ncbi:hypothetical protein IV102_07955 [bacterium]|nr:hypothetical protein [bacterium]
MPENVADLGQLKDLLPDIRRANVLHHLDLMAQASQQGVEVICFGELFPAPYFALGTDPMWIPMAEDAQTGPTVSELRAAARQHQMIVIAPIYELDFRKAHIPFGGNEQGSFHENFYYGRSDGQELFPVFSTSVGKIGVATCYDRHFHYVMPSLARGGAELIFCPSVTFGSKSERMWQMEFPTDAARFPGISPFLDRATSWAPMGVWRISASTPTSSFAMWT